MIDYLVILNSGGDTVEGLLDDELVLEIKHGSKAAMEVLVRRYYKTVYSYCARHIGNIATAEDLTHDIFLKVMKSLPNYDSRGSFINWLMTISVNVCRNYFATAYHKHEDGAVDVDGLQLLSNDNLDEHIDRCIEKQTIVRCLRRLPEAQREAILLRFYYDLKLTDIANITDVSLPTVKYRIKKATSKLKEWMEVYEDDDEKQPKIRIVK